MKVSVVKPIWVDDPDYIFGTDGRGAPLLSLFAENRSAKSSGWWFQRFFIFHFIYGMSSFPLTNSIIFQRGRAQPPTSHCFCISFWCGEKTNPPASFSSFSEGRTVLPSVYAWDASGEQRGSSPPYFFGPHMVIGSAHSQKWSGCVLDVRGRDRTAKGGSLPTMMIITGWWFGT